jgi:hypothetical protein
MGREERNKRAGGAAEPAAMPASAVKKAILPSAEYERIKDLNEEVELATKRARAMVANADLALAEALRVAGKAYGFNPRGRLQMNDHDCSITEAAAPAVAQPRHA